MEGIVVLQLLDPKNKGKRLKLQKKSDPILPKSHKKCADESTKCSELHSFRDIAFLLHYPLFAILFFFQKSVFLPVMLGRTFAT